MVGFCHCHATGFGMTNPATSTSVGSLEALDTAPTIGEAGLAAPAPGAPPPAAAPGAPELAPLGVDDGPGAGIGAGDGAGVDDFGSIVVAPGNGAGGFGGGADSLHALDRAHAVTAEVTAIARADGPNPARIASRWFMAVA